MRRNDRLAAPSPPPPVLPWPLLRHLRGVLVRAAVLGRDPMNAAVPYLETALLLGLILFGIIKSIPPSKP